MAEQPTSRDILRARDAPVEKRPGSEDLKPGVVTKRVLKDCASHATTIFPLTGTALAIAWTVMIAPSPASLMVAIGCTFIGACSFLYHYVLKGPERVVARQKELMALRRQHDLYEGYRVGLECQDVGFDEGAKEAGELIIAYEKLAKYLASKEAASAASFALQAEDVYKQGSQTIRKALDLYKALQAVDVKTLKKELKTWQTKRAKLEGSEPEAKTLDKQISAHSRRLTQHDENTGDLAELFAQVDDIEAALETTYMDLVRMGNVDPATYLSQDGGAADRMRSAVAARQRVQDRLRSAGEEDEEKREKRNKYIQLAEAAQAQSQTEDRTNAREED
ncbi:MAG: hypothetical protein SGJ27_26670 [Candidatus Melainabacteria bacterium]|nr:hypothetical protein [Candidatus Melainabacteria bacterium]